MTQPDLRAPTGAEALRRSFDQGFAAPWSADREDFESFVAIRVGEDPAALRFGDIAGIEAGKVVLPLPADKLFGVCGLRGRLVPVYSLARLFGHPEPGGSRHWLAVVGRDQPIAFTFSAFEGYLRAPWRDIDPFGDAGQHPYAEHLLRDAGGFRLVLAMARIVAATHPGRGSARE